MNNHNLFAALRAAFPAGDQRVAIETVAGLTYTWRDLDRASAMLANLLESLDLPREGDGPPIVLSCTDKSVEALMLYLATLRAGMIYMPLNTAYQHAEVEYFFDHARPAVVVCAKRNFSWVSKLGFKAGVRHVFTLDEDRSGSLLDRASFMGDEHDVAARVATDPAAVVYTSGTTGRSKGALLSHGNLLSNALTLKQVWDWRPDDVLIHALPIFHVHGLFVATHAALLNGSTMLWLPKFEPHEVIERFARATVFMGVPTLYVRMLEQATLTHESCRSMRLFISGSAPLRMDTFEHWEERTGHLILERYGMSETLMLTSNPCRSADGARRGGTVGRPLEEVGLRVVGERGQPLPAGEIGGIEVKGPSVFSGYLRMPEKTAEDFTSDGWFKTGDVGRFDAQGYLTIVGRSKDLVITGGFNVYPAEIENFLNEMPDIAESAVVGVPHPDFGECVIAFVVPQGPAVLDEDVLIATLKRQIANFKVPKRIFTVDQLPRNAMGKVQKNLLREPHLTLFQPACDATE